MLCLIAGLLTEVPTEDGMADRCREYLVSKNTETPDIVIEASRYRSDRWPGLSADNVAYMESAGQFYYYLLDHDGMMLHASATVIDGEAYLFAGQSHIGKSTHANLLKELFPDAQFINDDKPALRLIDGQWIAYGTPWSGKHGINMNAAYPLKAICLLTTRRDRNDIRIADPVRAAANLIACSAGRANRTSAKKLSALIDRLMRDIPIYEMDSLANIESAKMAYRAMKDGLKNEN